MPVTGPASRRRGHRGGTLIEVLIAILVCAFGLLGFAGVQVRATSAEFEAFERSQALLLVEDMVNRINANRAAAGNYVTGNLIGAGDLADCGGLAAAARDLCEWGNLLRGSSETRGGARIGAMISARGCITRPVGSTDRYLVSVVWQGVVETGGSANPCGVGDGAFPVEALRRSASSVVCVALLRDAASAPAVPRC
jgi:type IV pilus assembly protein PilV